MENLNDAAKLLNSCSILSLTLAKSCNTINSIMGGPLSSSSSGHNMQEHENDHGGQNQQQQPQSTSGGKSSKSASATTSPIKDTIRGSQEMIKKLMSKDRSGLSSSSSEKVNILQ